MNNDKKQITPAPYSPTSEQELIEMTVLRTLLLPNRIRPHLSEQDKTPNIDGYLDLIDENSIPIGKLEVQVKKLPDEFEEKPKFPSPTSLIVYARDSTTSPVLLICVDIHNAKAYWCSMDHFFVEKYLDKIKSGQQTIMIHFPVENCLDGKYVAYLDYWKAIFDRYSIKLKNFDNLEKEHKLIRERSNSAIGISKPEIKLIHSYLDQLNRLLDLKFDIIKRVFFPNSWKVGFAYHRFEEEFVKYEHYPIPVDKNDVQIKEIDDNLELEIRKTRLELVSYINTNPIIANPVKHATSYVETKLDEILKNQLLDHRVDTLLAREFVFSFIDNFHTQMGLEEKDEYSIEEIVNGFFRYLPLWISEVTTDPNVNSFYWRTGYHDPSFYLTLTPVKEREKIDKNVRTKIQNNTPIVFKRMGDKKFHFGIFQEMLTFLNIENIQKIERVYSKKNYHRFPHSEPRWIWNVFSKSDAENNLKVFFDNYPRIYTEIVEKNFPLIKSELPVFDGASFILFVFDLKDEYSGHIGDFTYPYYYMYYLHSDDCIDLKIQFIAKDEFDNSDLAKDIESKRTIEIDGKIFKLFRGQGGCMDFLFDEFPLLTFLYDDLKRDVKSILKNT